jgi:hypothetical protein
MVWAFVKAWGFDDMTGARFLMKAMDAETRRLAV